ncbi:MAG: hypothetical protein M1826_004581 [Phylliscum demangeonii]|nr:MAG: hypothetical protein M1826_004581 [Phylliscum demangeonii]
MRSIAPKPLLDLPTNPANWLEYTTETRPDFEADFEAEVGAKLMASFFNRLPGTCDPPYGEWLASQIAQHSSSPLDLERWWSFANYFHCTQFCQQVRSNQVGGLQARCQPGRYMAFTLQIMNDCNHEGRCTEQLPKPVHVWTQDVQNARKRAQTEMERKKADEGTQGHGKASGPMAWIPSLATTAKQAARLWKALERSSSKMRELPGAQGMERELAF